MCRTEGPLAFFGLADGQTGKRHCVTGAEEILRVLYRFVSGNSIGQLSGCKYLDELRYQIIRLIREKIEELARSLGEEASEFASTVVVLAADRMTGRYMTIHLGDGCVIGVRNDGEVGHISGPEYGLTRGYTWLTSSQDALSHLRVSFGDVRGYRRVVLATDGADRIHWGRQIRPGAARILSEAEDAGDILALVKDREAQDDASCIAIDISCPA